jgi:DNA polymerase-3 subunit alpha
MPAIALTDHGVMYGAIELIKTCKGKNIKPIIGNEMYVINGDIEEKKRCRRLPSFAQRQCSAHLDKSRLLSN